MDIVQCGWTNLRMSEKKLIELLEKRIRGEKIELPEGY
jgi:DNA replication initiation complex subunit (GINS family)